MKNNWPETIGELLDECEKLSDSRDLYTLGKVGEPYPGESEPRVDGTDYLAGEYRYGVAMIPAQWVTHVIPDPSSPLGECLVDGDGACTNCGADMSIDSYGDYTKYCGNCGARVMGF